MSQYIIIGGDGREYGPKEEAEVREWVQQGRLNALSQIKEVGEDEWVSLGSRPEFSFQQSDTATAPPLSAGPSAPPTYQIPTYLAQSILVTLCCCLPVGIPAIVYASRIDNLMRMGQYTEAQECSRKAKMWCWISFGIGIPANIIVFILQFTAEFANSGF
ncbi:MAG: CD225/dispanin family protein [Limisphaerales bacterium]